MMDFIRPLIPAPYRILLLAAVLASLWLWGYWKGSSSVREDWEAERASYAVAEAQARAEASRIENERSQATLRLMEGYESRLSAARAHGKRLCVAPPAANLPGVSDASGSADEAAPGVPDSLGPDCAEVAEQLLSLQEWVRSQQTVKP